MKSKWLIENRIADSSDAKEIEVLKWVLESPECPMCNHPQVRDLEIQIFNGNMTPSYLEVKNGWSAGIVEEHMKEHMTYDPQEAKEVEETRREAITTLDMAEDVFGRINSWLDEWEAKKDEEGIDGDWLANATRLIGQANSSLKLIGTLKKEIGVDSQLLLANQQVNGVMGILVDVLRAEPHLLNQIELRVAALKAPTYIQDGDWEEV
tara:strand:+ start:14462 stop:15085 length:624 start_codon:yes stop_codon:yes gene_type:complete